MIRGARDRKTVLVGLSGGVDSSVAAFLLKNAGHRVIGITMSIWDGRYSSSGKHACYGPDEEEEIREAREIAALLDIPYEVYNCSAAYKQEVLAYFRTEYLSGRTPNPCIRCNQQIKFGMLPWLAANQGLQYDYFATGHYADCGWDQERKRFVLKKGIDPRKDQTYFLYRLSQEQLSQTLFPLGKYTKDEVRNIARSVGIPAVEKEESQDFYGGDYKELLEMPPAQGDIILSGGEVVGKHSGFWNFTIGQRKGLGVAYSEPLYVIGLDPEYNRVVVGTRPETFSSSFQVRDLNWIALDQLVGRIEVTCKIRSAQREREATIEPAGEGLVRVSYNQPNDSVAPGQSAVFYSGDLVVGGGIII